MPSSTFLFFSEKMDYWMGSPAFEKYLSWIVAGFGIGIGTWRICEDFGVGSKVSAFKGRRFSNLGSDWPGIEAKREIRPKSMVLGLRICAPCARISLYRPCKPHEGVIGLACTTLPHTRFYTCLSTHFSILGKLWQAPGAFPADIPISLAGS